MEVSNKTLQEIDGEDWGEPEWQSYVVMNCHRLRRVPIKDFTVEDLRLMVGQKMALEYVLPLALNVLEKNPVAAGDFYEGDLLEAVERVGNEFWQASPILREKWLTIVEKAAPLKAEFLEEEAEYQKYAAE